MEDKEIFELNKAIRKYKGENTFLTSLQKTFKKNSKYQVYFEYNGRKYKRLSDRQYEVVKSIFAKMDE